MARDAGNRDRTAWPARLCRHRHSERASTAVSRVGHACWEVRCGVGCVRRACTSTSRADSDTRAGLFAERRCLAATATAQHLAGASGPSGPPQTRATSAELGRGWRSQELLEGTVRPLPGAPAPDRGADGDSFGAGPFPRWFYALFASSAGSAAGSCLAHADSDSDDEEGDGPEFEVGRQSSCKL